MSESIVDDVLAARYYQEGETCFEDVCHRVANYIGDNDTDRDIYYKMMVDGRFLPNSPCLMNAGTKVPMMSACYSIGISDDMNSILNTFHNAAIVMKYGGGVGIDFSPLRPKDAPIASTGGSSSGVVEFMKLFDAHVEAVRQGGKRRGAAIATLDISHPDIEEFIECKTTEGALHNMNISIRVTDDFMRAVERGNTWHLQFGGKHYKSVDARNLYSKIVNAAWKYGEPGLIFIDKIKETNPYKIDDSEYGIGVNPCVTGDTLVSTPDGLKRADSFVVGDSIITTNGIGYIQDIEVNPDVETYRVDFSDGGYVNATMSHQFMAKTDTTYYDYIPLCDLSIGSRIMIRGSVCPNNAINTFGLSNYDFGLFVGIVLGDGCITSTQISKYVVKVACDKTNTPWCEALENILTKVGWTGASYESDIDKSKTYVIHGNSVAFQIVTQYDLEGTSATKHISTKLLNSNVDVIRGIVSGLISTDGNVNITGTSPCIRFNSVSKSMIETLRLALHMFDITPSYHVEHRDSMYICGRKCKCKDKHELIISGRNIRTFYENITLYNESKQHVIDTIVSHYPLGGNYNTVTITNITPIGKHTVYDLHEPIVDNWITNGYVSRGCGEVTLMTCDGGGESCNLGSLNLAEYYDPIRNVDYGRLQTDVSRAIRFLDAVIDKNFYPVPEIEQMTKKFRRLGLGIMGWHDLLLKLKIPYDSEEAIQLAETVMGIINTSAAQESVALARSTFGGHRNETFVYNLEESELDFVSRDHDQYHNIARTCIAPTGTIATIAGCSYGMEPIYSLAHIRYTWVDGEKHGYMQVHQQFEHDLFKVLEMTFTDGDNEDRYHNVIDHAYEKGTIQDIAWLPEDFRRLYKTALDIDYIDHIKMQAAFQKHVDNNISKTINLPHDVGPDVVDDIYKQAWHNGLKGVTIYRTGSRDDEVLELKRDEQLPNDEKCENTYMTEFDCDVAPHRPKDLPGRTFKMQSGCGKLWVTVNYHENHPYEVFVSTGGTGGCKAMADALGRMISLALRNELQVEDVIKQLRRVKCDVAMKCAGGDGKSCADIVAKCIGEVMSDLETTPAQTNATMTMTESGSDYCIRGPTYTGEQLASCLLSKEEANPKAVCPECGDPIMLIEGCITCPSCGWSKCK